MPRDMFEAHFEKLRNETAPLAARMRPQTLADYVGQEHLVGEGRALRRAIDAGELPSIILWGPPGSGKTTLAFLMANASASYFAQVSAVSAGVADLRKIIEEAKQRRLSQNQKTILFIDEIHRFNKSQQDTILPYVEDGTVTLIGATTENPSFEVISPLLSRSRTYVLQGLTAEQMRLILDRAISDTERGIGSSNVVLSDDAAAQIKDGELPLLMDGSHVIVDARLNFREERGEWSLSAHAITPLRRAPGLIKKILFALKPGPDAGDFLEKIVAHTRKVDGTTIVQVGFIQPDGRVLVAEAARGMTTRFDTETYGTFGRHPACAGVQIEPIAPTQAPQRKYGPRA